MDANKIKKHNASMMAGIFSLLFILASILMINLIKQEPQEFYGLNYTFIINGEYSAGLATCDTEWHYDKIDGFIPCVVNKTIGGIGGKTINWSISPQENCANIGGKFTGLNMINETRSKELYDELLPMCYDLDETQISYIWLNATGCICEGEDQFLEECYSYDCGRGLVVEAKE